MTDPVIFANTRSIYSKMARAALIAERDLSEISLLAVTKEVQAGTVAAAVGCGLRAFGESRIQAAKTKIPAVAQLVPGAGISWHLIGHLQKNKVKEAVGLFDLIHSVDSPELAELLNAHAAGAGKIQKVLIQVKLSDEESKHGIEPEKCPELLALVSGMKNLRAEGFMTVPPYFEDPEQARPYFRRLRQLRDEALALGYNLKELSMGMSHDFEVAITEGATIIRVGTALFGERRKEKA